MGDTHHDNNLNLSPGHQTRTTTVNKHGTKEALSTDEGYDGDIESFDGNVSTSDWRSEVSTETLDYASDPSSSDADMTTPDFDTSFPGFVTPTGEEDGHQGSEEDLLLEAVDTFFGDFDWDLPDDPEFMKRLAQE